MYWSNTYHPTQEIFPGYAPSFDIWKYLRDILPPPIYKIVVSLYLKLRIKCLFYPNN